jgi:U3 small nucleolar RNA-associated protein 15
LVHRDALQVALSNRVDLSLEPMAKFLMKHIANPRYTALLVHVATVVLGKSQLIFILDMYSCVIGQSIIIDELFSKIKEKVEKEIRLQQELTEIIGLMDTLLASSSLRI